MIKLQTCTQTTGNIYLNEKELSNIYSLYKFLRYSSLSHTQLGIHLYMWECVRAFFNVILPNILEWQFMYMYKSDSHAHEHTHPHTYGITLYYIKLF